MSPFGDRSAFVDVNAGANKQTGMDSIDFLVF